MSYNRMKEVMESIKLSKEEKRQIIDRCRERKVMAHGKCNVVKKRFILAGAIGVIVCGLTTYGVIDYVDARMTSISKAEVQETLDSVYGAKVEASSFSRKLSEGEKQRYNQLYQSYKEGTFPKGEIIQIESEDQVVENKLCYIIADSKYILPNRELTDEEILEYIDFNKKIDYSLSQQEEIKKENKERAEHQKVIRQEIKKR